MPDQKPVANGPALYGKNIFGEPIKPKFKGRMAPRFLLPPFSVLNARDGFWQARKRAWIRYGIKGEEGRDGHTLGFSETAEHFGWHCALTLPKQLGDNMTHGIQLKV